MELQHQVLPFAPRQGGMSPPRPKADDDDVHVDGPHLDVAMLKLVAMEASKQTMADMLAQMGIDATKPFEAQKDFMFLRSRREWSEKGMWHAVTVIITLAVAGLGAWIWTGFKMGVK